ncbi:MAG: hypothetical protein IK095_07560 [Oscillospiraceae bacterium]|nr:hypothetical protein [Oscillospiraceae bacterium]
MEDRTILLWSQSVQGMAGGKRMHLGETASWYPQEQRVRIRSWGPRGESTEEISLPASAKTELSVLQHLKSRGISVPFDTLRRAKEKSVPSAEGPGSLLLPDGTRIRANDTRLSISRLEQQGYTEHRFFLRGQELARIGIYPYRYTSVSMSAMGRELLCQYEQGKPPAPGAAAREVRDNVSMQTLLRVFVRQPAVHTIQMENGSLQVERGDVRDIFVYEHRHVGWWAREGRREEMPPFPEDAGEPYALLEIYRDLPADAILAMLLYPFLGLEDR